MRPEVDGRVGIIVAFTQDRVIGRNNEIPWHYPADLKRFKALTVDSTVIMGRKTFESIGRPLPRRTNHVVTRRDLDGVSTFPSVETAWSHAPDGPVWFIGGASIYEAAFAYADFIDVTRVPDVVPVEGSVQFPEIPADTWAPGPISPHPDDDRLTLQRYRRREPAAS